MSHYGHRCQEWLKFAVRYCQCFAQLPLLSSSILRSRIRPALYARSPPNCPHSEMTAKGAPIGSNLLVRTDRSPLAVICPDSFSTLVGLFTISRPIPLDAPVTIATLHGLVDVFWADFISRSSILRRGNNARNRVRVLAIVFSPVLFGPNEMQDT